MPTEANDSKLGIINCVPNILFIPVYSERVNRRKNIALIAAWVTAYGYDFKDEKLFFIQKRAKEFYDYHKKFCQKYRISLGDIISEATRQKNLPKEVGFMNQVEY